MSIARPRVEWRSVGGICLALGLVLVALSGRYGYHRDELYFLEAGHHLAWGYPDQGPVTPFLAWAFDALGQGSLYVFRLPATLASVGIALLSALMARELGGGRYAQPLAALAAGSGTYLLATTHMVVTSTFDLLAWVTITWLVMLLLRGADERLWLLVGAVAGVGLLNKQLPLVLLLALLVGVALTPSARPVLRSPWLGAGGVLAAALWAPLLVWQAQHDWPQLTLAGQIRDEYGVPVERFGFLFQQLGLFSIGATILWVTGWLALWRRAAWATYRVFAWAGIVVLGVFVLTAGQGYYPGGIYPALFAAGAVVVEEAGRAWRSFAVVGLTAALFVPAALPVLPLSALAHSPLTEIDEQLREQVGWPQLADLVADAYATIPTDERSQAIVFTANYGEAGAVDRFGPGLGLPTVWSGHNGYGLWGPPPDGAAPVVVVWQGDTVDYFFSGCIPHGRVTGPVDNEETERTTVYVCDALIGSWAAAWPLLVHLDA